jgi:hypothetical protein
MTENLTPIDLWKAEQLDPVQQWRNYFNSVPRYRGHYFGEMKRQVAQILRDNGMVLEEVGKVVNLHHSSVIHRLRSRPHIQIRVVVEDNLNKWIKEGLYPKSEHVQKMSEIHDKYSPIRVDYTTYKLVNKLEL